MLVGPRLAAARRATKTGIETVVPETQLLCFSSFVFVFTVTMSKKTNENF